MKKQKSFFIAILLAICIIIPSTMMMGFAAQDNSKNVIISSALSAKISESQPTDKIPVIVIMKDQSNDFSTSTGKKKIADSQKPIKDILNAVTSKGKVRNIKQINVINCIGAEATPDVISSLSTRTDIKTIEIDNVYSIPTDVVITGSALASLLSPKHLLRGELI